MHRCDHKQPHSSLQLLLMIRFKNLYEHAPLLAKNSQECVMIKLLLDFSDVEFFNLLHDISMACLEQTRTTK